METGAVQTTGRHEQHVAKLQEACEWLGITQGRAVHYPGLVSDFFRDETRTRESVLAYSESCEITDIYFLWRRHAGDFPGLREHLREVCRKGPTLREDEKPAASSNRPRNDAFTCLVAGTLLNAGVPVVAVEGFRRGGFSGDSRADMTLMEAGVCFDLECKRPQSKDNIVPLLRRARAQLEEPARKGRAGIVAIDCSVIVRPAGTLLEYPSGTDPEAGISKRLEALVPRCDPFLTPQIIGLILLARVPGMMMTEESPVLGSTGQPFRYFRPDTIMSWLAVGNAQSPGGDILREFAMRVHRYKDDPSR